MPFTAKLAPMTEITEAQKCDQFTRGHYPGSLPGVVDRVTEMREVHECDKFTRGNCLGS